MRIAIACSGLGHVARGVEAWAADTAEALAGLGVNVTLFSAGDKPERPYERCLKCRRRDDSGTRRLAARLPGALWRWGLITPYGIEQASFTWQLQKVLRREAFDIVHVQDPMVADWCRRLRQLGRLSTKEILSHGTEEPADFLARFPYVLHLLKWHYDEALAALSKSDPARVEEVTRHWDIIPNFVDTAAFSPSQERATPYRTKLGIGPEERVFGCAAAVKKDHKRIDYLIREFSAYLDGLEAAGEPLPWLFIAGAAHEDSPDLQSLAEEIGYGRIHFFFNIPRARMALFHRSLDVFLLTSLFEMQGIAVIEALATGVPVIAHHHPVLRDVVGEGGATIDLTGPGDLTTFLRDAVTDDWIAERGQLARQHAVSVFAREKVIKEYVRYYQQVLADRPVT